MKILSIDTSSSICSVAILEDNQVVQELSIDDKKTHSQNLMPLIDEILKKTNLKVKDINVISCNKGPGSFTGIRIGVATAKGLAEPHKIKIIGVSSLEGLAYNINEQTLICTLIDARNDNVYFGLFDNTNNDYIIIEKFEALNITEVNNILKKYSATICFVGDGAQVYSNKLYIKEKDIFAMNEKNNANSVSIAKAAIDKIKLGVEEDETPMYLRPSQAERLKN